MSSIRKGTVRPPSTRTVRGLLASVSPASAAGSWRDRPVRLVVGAIALVLVAVAVAFLNGGSPAYTDILVASDTDTGDWLGSSVAVSGQTVAVGAFRESGPPERRGAVYVGERDAHGRFVEHAKLLMPDALAGNQAGFSVALDGDWLAAGAPGIPGKPGGDSSRGRVDVFHREAGQWVHQLSLRRPGAADNDRYGFSLAMAGAVLVVGARGVDDDAGAVYVHRLDNPADPPQELRAPEPAAGDLFGEAIAFDGTTLFVGSPGRDDYGQNTGAVYVFTLSDDGQLLADAPLSPPVADINGRFGIGVDVDGRHAIVGASHWDVGGPPGRVWFVSRDEHASWGKPYAATAAEGEAGISASASETLTARTDMEGFRVAIDRTRAVASAHLADSRGVDSGAVVLFHQTDDGWRRGARIVPPDGDADDVFGIALALEDGHLVAGAEKADVAGRHSGGFYLLDTESSH